MARSTYVYLAQDEHGYPACAATVKYEFIRWLKTVPEERRPDFTYWRMGDGSGVARRARLSLEELIAPGQTSGCPE